VFTRTSGCGRLLTKSLKLSHQGSFSGVLIEMVAGIDRERYLSIACEVAAMAGSCI
jgi:hypothetical protein